MNKFLRLASTLVVGNGLILLFAYLIMQNNVSSTQLLEQPSYYTLQNYWYLLLAGCGCVAFSIISCFLAWNKNMDTKVEVLPNAVGAEKSELLGWLSGSSLDTARKEKEQAEIPTQRDPQTASTDVDPDTQCTAKESAQEDATQRKPGPEEDTQRTIKGPASEDTVVSHTADGATELPGSDAATTFGEEADTAILDDDKTVLRPK